MADPNDLAAERLEFIRMTRDSAAAIAPRDGDLRRVRALPYASPGFDPAVWRQIAKLGWIGLRLPEEVGGAGMSMAESVALYEELGAGLVPEPLIAGSLAATLLAETSETALLDTVLAGQALVAVAWQASPNAIDLVAGPAASRHGVPMAGAASHLLVSVRESGRTRLLLLDPSKVDTVPVQRQDGTTVATLRISGNARRMITEDVGGVLEDALDQAALGTAAYLLGVAEHAFGITLDYLKQRKQFG